MTKLSVLLAAVLAPATALPQESQQGADSWMQHPQIREIRRLYQDVEAAVEEGQYSRDERRVMCRGYPIGATLFVDSGGVVRKYERTRLAPDVIAEARYYYDSGGMLRFSFQSLRARSGTEKELRTYYDESGQLLYADERLVEGPDEPVRRLPAVWDPREDFQSLCPESTPRSVAIVDIQARLFCERTGEFTQDVINDSIGIVLWNVIVRGNDAGCASHSTLVLIAIQGPPGEYLGDVYVEMLVESYPQTWPEPSPPDTVYHDKARLAFTNAEGRQYVPVFLYDTGCSGIEVYAWISGARETTERNEAIPFACGE
jgi:hypothetical protein